MAEGDLTEYRLAEAEKSIEAQQQEISSLRDTLQKMQADSAERERKRLLWGITSLGAVLMTMSGVLWQHLGTIIGGPKP